MRISKFLKLCFSIIATSVHNWSLILYYINYSKSLKRDSIQELFKTPPMPEKRLTQMQRVIKDNNVSVAILNDYAYWVKNNSIFRSKVSDEGLIDIDNASEIDVFSLNERETKNLLKIIDSISE
jgi:hypothetical protein